MSRSVPLSLTNIHARADFLHALEIERDTLLARMQSARLRLADNAPLTTVIAVARSSDDPGVTTALQQFEAAMRPALAAYLGTAPKRDASRLNPSARFLVAHYASYTEVPIDPSWIQRVVIWWQQSVRRWRR
jgi:hypothetical protein